MSSRDLLSRHREAVHAYNCKVKHSRTLRTPDSVFRLEEDSPEFDLVVESIRNRLPNRVERQPLFVEGELALLYCNFSVSKRANKEVYTLTIKSARKRQDLIGRYCIPIRVLKDNGSVVTLRSLVSFAETINPDMELECGYELLGKSQQGMNSTETELIRRYEL
jgi:hypothetical protein